MTTKQDTGPTSSSTAKTGVGFTGVQSMSYSGRVIGTGDASSTNVLYDNVNVPVTAGMQLSYKLFPTLDNGITYAATYAAVDLAFTDGTRLSTDYNLTDQNGFAVDAASEGTSDSRWPDQWNSETIDLSSLAGKTVEKILFTVHLPEGAAGATADTSFKGYLDDVTLDQAPTVDHSDGLVSYVDTRRGTNSSGGFSRGNNMPAVGVPNWFNFLVPMTNADSSGTIYQYQANNNAQNRPTLNGIGISHEPSIWMGDRNQVAFMPENTDSPTSNIDGRRLSFSHDNEIARPDLYQVAFDNGQVAAVTPTDHGAMFAFTYPSDAGSVIVDQVAGSSASFTVDATGLVTGWTDYGTGWGGTTRMFLAGQFDQTPIAVGKTPNGNRSQSQFAAFDTSTNKTVQLQVATSFISLDQAESNLSQELAGKSFDQVHQAAMAQWNDRLGVITDVVGATDTQLTNLYSDLYRVNLYPNSQFENTGKGAAGGYQYASPVSSTTGSATATTTNAKIVDGKIYVNNGFWDTYRAEWPAISLLYPDETEELVDGFVQQYRDGGWIARWSSPGYADLMTGTSSDVAFAQAYADGRLTNKTALDAFDAAVKNATTQPASSGVGRKGLENGIYLGYTTADLGQSASWGLEGYINDYGIAQMAAKLAADPETPASRVQELTDDAAYFQARSEDFVNMFNPLANTFASRNADGSWVDGADMNKAAWSGAFTESNAWEFGYHAPFDVDGLAALYGGRQQLIDNITQFLNTPEKAAFSGIHEAREARDVRLGLLGMSNQPSHHIPYVLAEAGAPSEAQELIATIQDRLFVGSDIGQGYPGDEDNGEFSGWYVLSALGFYPLAMGSGNYTVGHPMFDSATLHTASTTLVVNAPGASEGKTYVAGVTINGTDVTTTTFDGSLIRAGGTLTYTMSDTPSTWGAKDLTETLAVPDTQVDATTTGFGTLSDAEGTAVAALTDNTMKTSTTFGADHASLVWKSAVGPVSVNRYTLTSVAGKGAPASWTLSGSSDGGSTWTAVDSRSSQTFPFGTQARPFSVGMPTAFTSYKLDAKTADGTPLTLAEIELFAKPAGGTADIAVTGADPLSTTVGTELSSALGTIIGPDSDASAYTVTVSAGDGSDPAAAVLASNGLGGFAVTAPHTYAEPGTYTVTITASDQEGRAGQATTQVVVTRDMTLAGVFNNTCLADTQNPASCDGQSSGYMREKLASYDPSFVQGAKGIPVGTTGLTFDLPAFVPGAPDNVTSDGATFALDLGAGATRISLIGAATETAKNLTATVTFTDGSTQTIPLQFGDWVGASGNPSFGNTVVGLSQGRYIGTSPEGSVKNTAVYATVPVTLDTDADGTPKTAAFLTLPQETGSLRTTGRAHLFAVASDGTRTEPAWLAPTPATGLTAQAGQSLSGVVADFTGGLSDTPTATINWGDGTATTSGTVATGTVSGDHTFAEPGTYTAIVTMDDGVKSVSADVTITVTAAPVYTPAVSAAPQTVAPADTVTLTGSGYAPNETVTITNGNDTTVVTTDNDGAFTQKVVIPSDATDGAWTLTTIGEVSQVAASAQVTVRSTPPAQPTATSVTLAASPSDAVVSQQVHLTATVAPADAEGTVAFTDSGITIGTAPVVGGTASADVTFASSGDHALTAAFAPRDEALFAASTSPVLTLRVTDVEAGKASLTLSASKVQAGESLTVTGHGFAAAEPVVITLASQVTVLSTVTTDAGGAFAAVVTVPAGTAAGDHTVTGVGQTSGLSASAKLTVAVKGTGTGTGDDGGTISTEPGALGSTGARGVFWLVGGAALLLAAGAAVLVIRRKRGATER